MKLSQTIRRLARRRAFESFRKKRASRALGHIETLETRCVLSAYNPSLEVPDDQTLFEGQPFDLTAIFQDADPADIYNATIDWGDGHVENATIDSSSVFNSPLTVRIDYSLDVNNFFDTQEKRDTLQLAADTLVSRFADTLSAILPCSAGSLTNTWEAILTHPGIGNQISLTDLSIASNEILVFAGGRNLEAPSLGAGGFGGFNSSGTQTFVDAVKTRGEAGAENDGSETDFGPWGGSISFSTRSGVNWHFGETTAELGSGETDFFTVAMHEMGHLLGFGTAPSWINQIDALNEEFDGTNAIAEFDEAGSPSVNSTADHWAEGTEDNGQETSMDPTIGTNKRKRFTPLDYAALDDIGWTVAPERQGSVSGGHTYADDGVYTISITLTDDAGGEVTETIEVTVQNTNPVVTAGANDSIYAGDLISITDIATFTDLGFNNSSASPTTSETFSYVINWGDGTSDNGVATIDSPGGPGSLTAGSLNGSHTYASADTYVVTVTLMDDDGGLDAGTLFVEVFESVDAVDDEFSTSEDSSLVVNGLGLLDNDSGGPLTVSAVSGATENVGTLFVLPSGAMVTVEADGEFQYDPRTSATLNALNAGETFDDSFTYTISDGRGKFSTATVMFEVLGADETAKSVSLDPRIVLSPTATDDSGHAQSLPGSAEWIDEWRRFWVEIWVRVDDSTQTGVTNISTTVAFESDYFSAQEVNGGSAFDDGFSASANNTLGLVTITAGASLEAVAGAGQFALLARIEFAPNSGSPGLAINLNEPEPVRAAPDGWISIPELAEVTLAGSVEVTTLIQSEFATQLWPMLYDLDDDQRVGFGDLSLFSGVFLQSVNGGSSIAAKADFDFSGTVDFGDMSLLSANFLRTRASGDPIVFPTGFPEIWQTAPSTASSPASASSPPSETAMLMAEVSGENKPGADSPGATAGVSGGFAMESLSGNSVKSSSVGSGYYFGFRSISAVAWHRSESLRDSNSPRENLAAHDSAPTESHRGVESRSVADSIRRSLFWRFSQRDNRMSEEETILDGQEDHRWREELDVFFRDLGER